MLVLHSSGLQPGTLARVHPEAELVIVEAGLERDIEDEVLKQALAAMLGRFDLAPDAHYAYSTPEPVDVPVPRQPARSHHLRLVHDADATAAS